MKISFLPKSRLGKWSVGCGAFVLFAFLFGYIFGELLNVFTSEILMRIVGVSFVIAAIVSFFTGITAIIKNKEPSAMVFLSIIIGLVVIATIAIMIISDLLHL